MYFILSQIIGLIVSFSAIMSMQMKNVKAILTWQLVCNGLGALSYILLGGFSGCGIYLVAFLQTIVFYIFRKTDTKSPTWLAVCFILAYLLCSAATYKSPYDIISAVAALTCALSLVQEKPSNYRILMLLNGIIWIIYDLSVGAYTMIISHLVTALSAAVGILRLDLKKTKNSEVKNYDN